MEIEFERRRTPHNISSGGHIIMNYELVVGERTGESRTQPPLKSTGTEYCEPTLSVWGEGDWEAD